MSIENLISLCKHRWALPALCALAAGAPLRAYPLAQYLGGGRAGVKQGLDHLIALGFVKKTSGHGHPLRPEIYITKTGHEMAIMATPYAHGLAELPMLGGKPLGRWALPALTLAQTPIRFNDFGRAMPAITDRALSLTLQDLEAKTLLSFKRQGSGRRALGLYQATKTGQKITKSFISLSAA